MDNGKDIHSTEYRICGLTKKELTSCGKSLDNVLHSVDNEKITCHLCIDILQKKNDDLSI